jgi:hypothetical protein
VANVIIRKAGERPADSAQNVDWSNLYSCQWFVDRQVNLTDGQKLVIDQYQFSNAMLFVSKGLHQLTLALRNQGLAGISDLTSQYDSNEKSQNIRQNNYEQRFGYFKPVIYPKYKQYEQQLSTMQSQGPPDKLLDQAKLNLQLGQQMLKILEEAPANQRNALFM